MLKKFRFNRAVSKIVEDKLYEMALEEVESGILKKGPWARALSQSDGLDAKARSIYLQFRVEAMKNEAEIIKAVLEETEKSENNERIKSTKSDISRPQHIRNQKLSKQDLNQEKSNVTNALGDVTTINTSSNDYFVDVKSIVSRVDITESEIVDMIKEGEIKGLKRDGQWYVHTDNLSNLGLSYKSSTDNLTRDSGSSVERNLATGIAFFLVISFLMIMLLIISNI